MSQDQTPQDDASGWTTIKRKSRSRGKAHIQAKARASSEPHMKEVFRRETDPTPQQPRTTDLRPVAALDAEYRRIRASFEEETCCRQLREIVASVVASIKVVSKAVNLGVGSLDPDDERWIGRRSTYVQLVAFLIMVEELEKATDQTIKCIFQEPVFTESDKAFLASLGHDVVEHPAGLDEIDENSFFFGVHLYRGLYAKALDKHLPAIFVGTSFATWDDINQTANLESLKRIEETYNTALFPADPYSQAFSNTRIFWRPAPKSNGEKSKSGKPSRDQQHPADDVAAKLEAVEIG